MLRTLVALVLLANLFFLGWVQGWFAPGLPPPRQGEREPERITAQLHAEAVTVLPAPAASAALSAARAAASMCLQAGPFAEADLPAAESMLLAARVPAAAWTREPAPPPPRWLLYAGRVVDANARRTREEELQRLNLAFELLKAPPDLAPGLVLSRHNSQAEAESAMAAVAASAALRGLRVASLPAAPAQTFLRVARADPDQQTRLQALSASSLAGGFKPCASAP